MSEIEAEIQEVPVEKTEAVVEETKDVEEVETESVKNQKLNQRQRKKVLKNGELPIFTVVIIIQLFT